MKNIFVAFGVLIFLGAYCLLFQIYTSSPGHTTMEAYEAFNTTKPECYGVTFLLNKKATWADAPGRSICFGILISHK